MLNVTYNKVFVTFDKIFIRVCVQILMCARAFFLVVFSFGLCSFAATALPCGRKICPELPIGFAEWSALRSLKDKKYLQFNVI